MSHNRLFGSLSLLMLVAILEIARAFWWIIMAVSTSRSVSRAIWLIAWLATYYFARGFVIYGLRCVLLVQMLELSPVCRGMLWTTGPMNWAMGNFRGSVSKSTRSVIIGSSQSNDHMIFMIHCTLHKRKKLISGNFLNFLCKFLESSGKKCSQFEKFTIYLFSVKSITIAKKIITCAPRIKKNSIISIV